MNKKALLEKRMKRLNEKKDALTKKALASDKAEEVRSINEQLEEINADIEEVKDELSLIAEEEQRAANPETNPATVTPPANAQRVNGNIVGAFNQNPAPTQKRENNDPYSTMEYRQAFMKYAQTGEPIPANLYQRDGMPANTNSLGATIPTTTLNEFINLIRKRYGNLYSKVRKLNIPGAVKVPISELQATFKWITEDTVAPREDGGEINKFVEFSYNMAEIRVSQTLLSSIVALDIFEREIVRIMLIAYMQAMDTGIIRGTGNGQMLGILNDPRIIATGNVVEMTAADINNWTAWRKKFFAKLPLGYRDGEFIFNLATVDAYLETMADANNNPIFRQATGLEVNDGDARDPNGRFFGRAVSLVEPDILRDFDTAENGEVIGIFWQPDEYAINTNMQFGMRRWFDEDRNEWVNKMLTVVDGKVLNPMGYWLIKKKTSN
jgi:HK97 family phage major capsid protein